MAQSPRGREDQFSNIRSDFFTCFVTLPSGVTGSRRGPSFPAALTSCAPLQSTSVPGTARCADYSTSTPEPQASAAGHLGRLLCVSVPSFVGSLPRVADITTSCGLLAQQPISAGPQSGAPNPPIEFGTEPVLLRLRQLCSVCYNTHDDRLAVAGCLFADPLAAQTVWGHHE